MNYILMVVNDKVCEEERRNVCLDVLEGVAVGISEDALQEGYKRVVLSAGRCCLEYVQGLVKGRVGSIPVEVSSNGSFEFKPGDRVYNIENLCDGYRREHSLRVR